MRAAVKQHMKRVLKGEMQVDLWLVAFTRFHHSHATNRGCLSRESSMSGVRSLKTRCRVARV
jgi:hypothetical protein